MGLNTAASISFSQINSTSYFTNGNLGINTTNPTANLDVAGTINASGLSSLASITTGALSATNVSAGVINSSGLTTGNINFTGSLFQNGVAYVGSQWTTTDGNVSYTSGSVVATNAQFTNAEFTNATINNFSLGTNVTVNNLLASNLNLGISSMYSGSFVASNNVAIATDVTGLAFANANIRSFNASINVNVILSAGSSLYGMVNLNGTQNADGWSLYIETMGDDTGVTFTITSSGQIQYTSTNQSNWSSSTFRFNVQQFSATGTYSSLSANTQGSYIMDSIQLNSLTDAVPGVSNGPLYILGGATIGKRLNVNGVVSTGALSATNVSAGVVIASTSLFAVGNSNTVGSIYTTGGNVGIGISAPSYTLDVNGTINASGLSALANVTATGSGSGTNGTVFITGSDSYGHSLYVGTEGKRIGFNNGGSGGNIFAYDYGGNVAQNLVLQGPGGNLGIGTTSPSATLDVNGRARFATSVVSGTNGVVLITGNDNNGHQLFIGNRLDPNRRISFSTFTNYGNIYAHDFGSNNGLDLVLQAQGGNVGIGTWAALPAYKLDVNGTARFTSSVTINGSLSKGSGTFDIQHPLKNNPDERLVHSFIEGPRCDLIYRGTVQLVNGVATVNIDSDCVQESESAMAQGTFEALCANPVYYLQNHDSFDRVKASISGNILTITCENTLSANLIHWMVIAERKDQFIKEWDRTNSNGYLVTEYTKN